MLMMLLLLLFGVAWITEQGLLPRHWVRHPLVYILSLGVYAGIWAVYAAVAMPVVSRAPPGSGLASAALAQAAATWMHLPMYSLEATFDTAEWGS